MTEAERIAGKLTEAQRRLALWLSNDFRDWLSSRSVRSLRATRIKFREIGLVEDSAVMAGWVRLSPLGLEVKRILEGEE